MFGKKIKDFNNMYKLPVSAEPSLHNLGVPALERLQSFKKILLEEVNEIDEIILDLDANKEVGHPIVPEVEVLTKLADLLGDIQVYCASEMAKFGLPLDEVLGIIMDSNLSKLGADGLPIYDERGKVQKGPNYWKPEPKLQAMLAAKILQDRPTKTLIGEMNQNARDLLDKHNETIQTQGKVLGAFDPLPGQF
jgi:predicted HAD superfamily Cof-like phosphohydrolase